MCRCGSTESLTRPTPSAGLDAVPLRGERETSGRLILDAVPVAQMRVTHDAAKKRYMALWVLDPSMHCFCSLAKAPDDNDMLLSNDGNTTMYGVRT